MIKIETIVDDSMSFVPEAIEALRRFKALRTSTADPDTRLEAMQALVNELVDAYGLNVRIPLFTDLEVPGSFEPMIEEGIPVYPLPLDRANLSIITLLHKFAAIKYLTTDEKFGSFIDHQRFAVNLFRRVYPEEFAKLVMDPQTGSFVRPKDPEDTSQPDRQ